MLTLVWSLVCQTLIKKHKGYFNYHLYQGNNMVTKVCNTSVQALFKSERKPVRDYNLYAI